MSSPKGSVLKFLLRTTLHQFTFVLDLNFRELGNERADKAAAFQRIRVLEGRLQIESETGQKVEDAMSKLLRDYQDLELQISVSSKELAMLIILTCFRKRI